MDGKFVEENAIARSISHVPPAHYILKIESFSKLTEQEVEKYESGEFEVGGYKWRLVLYPNGNKSENVKQHMSIYLAIADTSSLSSGWEVYAVFRLFLHDQKKDKFLIVQDSMGSERRFHGLKLEWGFDEFIPLKAFKDASNGYIVKDTCTFGVKVFVKETKKAKRECLSVLDDASKKHVWKIENFSKLEAKSYESVVFYAGGLKWKIELYPKGSGDGSGSHLSMFLELAEVSSSKIFVDYELRVLSQVPTRSVTFKVSRLFGAPSYAWGWHRFVSLGELKDPDNGYLMNDVCVVEAEVTVLRITKVM